MCPNFKVFYDSYSRAIIFHVSFPVVPVEKLW